MSNSYIAVWDQVPWDERMPVTDMAKRAGCQPEEIVALNPRRFGSQTDVHKCEIEVGYHYFIPTSRSDFIAEIKAEDPENLHEFGVALSFEDIKAKFSG